MTKFRTPISKREREAIAKAYRDGNSLKAVRKRFRRSYDKIYEALRAGGVSVRAPSWVFDIPEEEIRRRAAAEREKSLAKKRLEGEPEKTHVPGIRVCSADIHRKLGRHIGS